MKKLDELKKNPLHDQEDEYRNSTNPLEGRNTAVLAVVIILAIGIVFYLLGLITSHLRP